MNLSMAYEMRIPEGEVLEIHTKEGVIWRKRTYFSAIVASADLGKGYTGGIDYGKTDYGVQFHYKGRGEIYKDGVLLATVDNVESESSYSVIVVSEDSQEGVEYLVEFRGEFSVIKLNDGQGANSKTIYAGKYVKIVSWDSNRNATYEYMFACCQVGSFVEYAFPSWVTKIEASTFNGTSIVEVSIPAHIQEIGSLAFGDTYTYNQSGLTTIRFLHKQGQEIKLPTAGVTGTTNYSGMAYSKEARELTVYTDNEIIRNYDWVADNCTVTFYHLDGSNWEDV